MKHLFASKIKSRRKLAEWSTLLALLVVGASLSGYLVWSEKKLSAAAEIDRMQGQARIIDENLVHQLTGVRNALEEIRSAVGADIGDAQRYPQRLPLKALKKSMPGVRAIMVMDATGRILASDDDLMDKKLDDRQFIGSIAGMSDPATLYLSQPYENTPGTINIKAALPIPATGRHPQGVVLAILNPEYFEVVMRSVLYAPDMRSAITDQSGMRLFFVPHDSVGMSGDKTDTFISRHLSRHLVATVLTGKSSPVGDERLMVQRTIASDALALNKTLVVSLSRNVGAMQSGWRRLAEIYGSVWTLFAVLSAIALSVIQRRRRLFDDLSTQREREQAEHAERIDMALKGADLGLWDWHIPDGGYMTDARAKAMLRSVGRDRARCWIEFLHEDDAVRVQRLLEEHFRGDSAMFASEHRLRKSDGDWIWVQSRGKVVQRGPGNAPIRMVGTHMDISERKIAEAEIEHLAFYDGLTNLPNRRLLRDRLSQAMIKAERNGQYGGLLFIDLDNFKELNDTLGHDMGDQLLRRVASRLQQQTREADTVSRWGGDEFVVLLEQLGSSRQEAAMHSELKTRKILHALNETYAIDGHVLHSAPSMGIALFGPTGGALEDLLKQADMAMYEAKSAGRNTFRFFDPQMQVNVLKAAELEADLRRAIVREELVLHYQPVIDDGFAIIGTEALVRWQHPVRGLIPPAEFIGHAEKSELILAIGAWVIRKACQQLVVWSRDPGMADVSIAVNVSARQFRQSDFVEQVLGAIESTGANPALLKLEITESMLLNDIEEVGAKMTALRETGIAFSLDDFGTGYSSLSYLRRLPLDVLKIDRSFVSEVAGSAQDATIVKSILALAHELGLKVVAEGVETLSQYHFLRRHGCRAFQGYLFCKPCTSVQLECYAASPDILRTGKPRFAE
ncbi:EAL domain-containing protein [Herbaspirillum sp. RV1423]|uniref:bifunctional diguanylate cyclase/phosphodiesterase n=1 Tax=Herbaspirillum sp. RV1423 TaxID=1443993 RepID=UPI0012DF96DA|nr:EAL domain-containing protein [Herbaspirillum sp. RV1423]